MSKAALAERNDWFLVVTAPGGPPDAVLAVSIDDPAADDVDFDPYILPAVDVDTLE